MGNQSMDSRLNFCKILTDFLQFLQFCIAIACIAIAIVAKVLHCAKLSYILTICKLQCNFAKLLQTLTICKQVCKFVNFLQAELAKGAALQGGGNRGVHFCYGGSIFIGAG